jgi:hypothetical protein
VIYFAVDVLYLKLPAVTGSQQQSVTYAGRQCTLVVSRRTSVGVGDIATGQFITATVWILLRHPWGDQRGTDKVGYEPPSLLGTIVIYSV